MVLIVSDDGCKTVTEELKYLGTALRIARVIPVRNVVSYIKQFLGFHNTLYVPPKGGEVLVEN